MQFKVLEKDKNMMRLEITNTDEATLYLLTQELLADDNVAVASYNMPHPQLDKPIMYLETKKGYPKTALKNAATKIAKQFEEALEELDKTAGTKPAKKPAAKPKKAAASKKSTKKK